jgi:hypothetical protein
MATLQVRARGRSLKDFPNLTAAERKLLRACRDGTTANFGGGLPISSTKANAIRPSLVRFLLLGGDDENPVHENGVQLYGAWIGNHDEHDLDLENTRSHFSLSLLNCALEGALVLRRANLLFVSMEGSTFYGVQGDALRCQSSLLLRNVVCNGEARIVGADIGGTLECIGGQFTNKGGIALAFDRAKILGDVSLGVGFRAQGEVRLVNVEIGGSLGCGGGLFCNENGIALNCDGAMIAQSMNLKNGFKATGETRLVGAQIGYNLDCEGGDFRNTVNVALNCDGATAKSALILRRVAAVDGDVNLTSMKAGSFIDDADFQSFTYVLDGFTYERFAGQAPTSAEKRLTWLGRQQSPHIKEDFRPQPWEQVIRVLRDMGHPREADKVAIAKQEQMRKAGKVGNAVMRFLHWLYGEVAGYGYRPMSSLLYLLSIWLLCTLIYFFHSEPNGVFAPTNPIIHNDAALQAACGVRSGVRETTWTICTSLPQEYTTFNAAMYSVDLILPLVNLQQENDWAPLATYDNGENFWLAMFTRGVVWFEILAGWMLSLLLVAVLGNLVKKD